jgi:hypothetical protein
MNDYTALKEAISKCGYDVSNITQYLIDVYGYTHSKARKVAKSIL